MKHPPPSLLPLPLEPESDTVTETPLLVAVFPAASRAMAVRVWEPFVAVSVFQERAYGGAVISEPRFTPSSLNWTPTTPTLSEAFADT